MLIKLRVSSEKPQSYEGIESTAGISMSFELSFKIFNFSACLMISDV